jgi:NADH-ubiquinone oxidoreductase chain 4
MRILPIFIVINGWGYQIERINARFYLLLYTLFFSFPFLLVLIFFQNKILRLNLLFCLNFLKIKEITFLFFIFFITAFLVKCPVYFLHIWLPKAHVEAPVIGSVYLAGILLKLGGFGISRIFFSFSFSIFVKITFYFLIFGRIIRTILCFVQIDQKCIIAFSSISHITIFVSCIFSNTFRLILISSRIIFFHGLISRNLFFFSYLIFNLSSNRLIFLNQGYKTLYKEFYTLFLITICLNLRIPPFLRFFSELLIFQNWIIISFFSFFFILFIIFFGLLYRIFLLVNSFHGKNLNLLFNFTKLKYIIILFFFLF